MIQNKTTYDENTKIWSGGKSNPKYGPDNSIGQIALQALMKDPDHISQICYHNGKQYTNHDLATLSIRVSQHFQKLQLQQCDVIGLCAGNSDFVAPLFFGAMLSGLTISTLDPSFDKDGIKHIFSITKPKIMCCDGAIYKTVKEALDEIRLNIKIYTMNDHMHEVPEILEFLRETGDETTFKLQPLKLGNLQTAAIICSSGTTGLPKGVCLSHESLLNNTFKLPIAEIKILCFSSLYWLTGLGCLIGATIANVTRVISQKGYNPEDFIEIIKKYKIEILISPPSQIAMLVASPKIKDSDMSSVKLCICLGSAVPYSLVEKMKPYMTNALKLSGFGMSEICGGISAGFITPNGSLGQLTTNVEVKVVDDDGNSLGPCERGEMLIRSLFQWTGYYGNTEATAATYDKDGWIHSGDIGYINNDGDLFVVDRKKDILKYNNFHFFPTEIENIITEIPGILEVCVCGIPDLVSTHLPAAAVVKSAGSNLTEEDVYKYVSDKMAHFKHLRGGVYFLDDLPKTASGKNLRRIVTEICEKLKNTQHYSENTSLSNL